MQAAQIIGGYSLGGADLLRRAMGKKKPEEMVKHREIFAEGAAKQGISREKSDEIFNYMEKFAGYGFQQIPRCRLRPDFLPDRMAQSPLPRRIYGSNHVV